jgi:hypothetical protein
MWSIWKSQGDARFRLLISDEMMVSHQDLDGQDKKKVMKIQRRE